VSVPLGCFWVGGKGFDTDKDGHVGDNPATPNVVEGAGEKETDWCFAYGEKEWMNPYEVKELGKPDRWSIFKDYLDDADDNDDLKMGCK